MQICAMKCTYVQSSGRTSCRHAARETSHGDRTTQSYVPQLAPMLLPLTAQPGSTEGESRLAGKEMLLHLEKRYLLQMLL